MPRGQFRRDRRPKPKSAGYAKRAETLRTNVDSFYAPRFPELKALWAEHKVIRVVAEKATALGIPKRGKGPWTTTLATTVLQNGMPREEYDRMVLAAREWCKQRDAEAVKQWQKSMGPKLAKMWKTMSQEEIAHKLQTDGVETFSGDPWNRHMVARILSEHYGPSEYQKHEVAARQRRVIARNKGPLKGVGARTYSSKMRIFYESAAKRADELWDGTKSFTKIAEQLEAEKYATQFDQPWSPTLVRNALIRHLGRDVYRARAAAIRQGRGEKRRWLAKRDWDTCGWPCPVVLKGLKNRPVVLGVPVEKLNDKQYRVIDALWKAGPDGLKWPVLKATCEGWVGDPRGILQRLVADYPESWGQVIRWPDRRRRLGARLGPAKQAA